MRYVSTLAVSAFLLAALAMAPARADTGFIGMQVQGMAPEIANGLGIDPPAGVLIRDVGLHSPAADAGVERGDILVGFDGEDVATFEHLLTLVGRTRPGQTIPIRVMRRGEVVQLSLTTGEWPPAWRVENGGFAALPQVGITVAALTQKVRKGFAIRWGSVGLVVTLVDEKKAQGTDLQRGELILQVDQKDVWQPKQLLDLYKSAKEDGRANLVLLVEGRAGYRFTLLPVR